MAAPACPELCRSHKVETASHLFSCSAFRLEQLATCACSPCNYVRYGIASKVLGVRAAVIVLVPIIRIFQVRATIHHFACPAGRKV
jgi:hypothetical protein